MPTMPNIKENMEKTNMRKIQVKFEYKKKRKTFNRKRKSQRDA